MRFIARYAWLTVVAALGSLALAGSAVASPTKGVTGFGQTTDFICADGTDAGAASISVSAEKKGSAFSGFVGGQFGIFGPNVTKTGPLFGGTINKNNYSVTGSLSQANCSPFFFEPTPVNVTISGQCGINVVIHYSDAVGEKDDFIGNVSCA